MTLIDGIHFIIDSKAPISFIKINAKALLLRDSNKENTTTNYLLNINWFKVFVNVENGNFAEINLLDQFF